MRTTLDLDVDLLEKVKILARHRKSSVGREISRLLRKALEEPAASEPEESFLGFAPFPAQGRCVTDDLIDTLRDGEGV